MDKNKLLSRKNRGKRSQMEIMGLMIVVILLIVGVLFAVKFIVLKKPSDTRQIYSRTQMASNLAMGMLGSSTAMCKGTTVADLLKDCALPYSSITCNDPSSSTSCAYVNNTLTQMLNNTVLKWNSKVEVKAWVSKDDYIFEYRINVCNDKKPGESETLFLPTKAGTLSFKVFICE
jgi:hypothetical protein